MSAAELKAEQNIAASQKKEVLKVSATTNVSMQNILLPLAWLVVGIPIAWGIFNALQKVRYF